MFLRNHQLPVLVYSKTTNKEIRTRLDAEIPAETNCNSTGWGLTSGGGLFLPNALQWAKLPLHARDACEEIFPGYITDGMVCAGRKGY